MPDIRFIDYRYRDLFKLPDGENIVITTIDGAKKLLQCCYLDEMHAKIGNNIYHIAQFAEFTRENGIIYRPENPKQEEYAIYEIRQIKDGLTIEYKFADYERAKNKINPLHYDRVYAGMLAKSRTLEDIFYEHNQESRPFRFKIHSLLSTSDIIVVTRKDNKTAYYVDNLGFKELPRFAKALTEKPPKQKNDYQR